MSGVTLDINRLQVVLHGVSASIAEEAVAGLEDALRRRLGRLRGSVTAASVQQLRIGPLDLPRVADATALRELVAERLLESLLLRADAETRDQEGA